MTQVDQDTLDMASLDFSDLEDRYGQENARAILRALEQFEGVRESDVSKYSWHERLKNVLELMKDGLKFQTRH